MSLWRISMSFFILWLLFPLYVVGAESILPFQKTLSSFVVLVVVVVVCFCCTTIVARWNITHCKLLFALLLLCCKLVKVVCSYKYTGKPILRQGNLICTQYFKKNLICTSLDYWRKSYKIPHSGRLVVSSKLQRSIYLKS